MKSIRGQLNWTVLLSLGLLEAAGLLATYTLLSRSLIREFDNTLLAKAQAVSTPVIRESNCVRVNFSDRFLRGFDDDEERDFFELWETNGTVIARSETLQKVHLPREVGTLQKPKYWSFTLPNARPGRAVGFQFTPRRGDSISREKRADAPAVVAPVDLVVATDRADLDGLLRQFAGVIVGVGAVILFATAAIVPRVLRQGLKPLGTLAQRAGQIDAQSLAERFDTAGLPEELHPITNRLNDLLARLESSFGRERRVSADLAHELRTPLAELRMLMESALKWPDVRDAGTDREALAIASHMGKIVQHMLALARVENGQVELAVETLELSRLVEECWRPFAERAAAKSHRVEFSLEAVSLRTDSSLWRAMLSNLFDNAVEYTPAGGFIRIGCGRVKERAELSVANDAPGLEASEVEKLFERFWRKESARTASTHLGLGLSLVQAYAKALGWDVSASLGEQNRLTLVARERAAGPG